MTINIIGSGNVAWHLTKAFKAVGHTVNQLPARELLSGQNKVIPHANIHIISVIDDAIPNVSAVLKNVEGIVVHTAGSIPMSELKTSKNRVGVLYPMQTFTKGVNIDFKEVGIFVEGSDLQTLETIKNLAKTISKNVTEANSETRKKMHLAAVFCCNMANHCYRLAERITETENIDFKFFTPLIKETARKVSVLSPQNAQTGPMRRKDQRVMAIQKSMIDDELSRQIYQLFAESIARDY